MNPVRFIVGVAALAALGGCGTYQTTSGGAYLASYAPAKQAWASTETDAAVRQAAAVEPLLRFPARIGLARVVQGQLTTVPPEEADIWLSLLEKHGTAYGTFVPVSPFIAELAGDAPQLSAVSGQGTPAGSASRVVRHIRLGAARQHLDAVIVYEISQSGSEQSTDFSWLDLTIIGGYLLPTRATRDTATATALMFDVRNGYPYFTAVGHARKDGATTAFGGENRRLSRVEGIRLEAVADLAEKLPPLFAGLAVNLRSPAPRDAVPPTH